MYKVKFLHKGICEVMLNSSKAEESIKSSTISAFSLYFFVYGELY